MVLKERVFCCGGRPRLATAYMIARDGEWEQKANMNEGRGYHGLLIIHSAAYVFGGVNTANSIKTCEKWEEDRWRNLPSMRKGRPLHVLGETVSMWLGVSDCGCVAP